MRDTGVIKATELTDLFFHENKKLVKDVTENIISRDGDGVILLMEGIDELPASCLADGMLLSNLLQGLSLPEVTILVTTRPWAGQMLQEKCGDQISRQFECLGFTKQDILAYAFSENKEEEKDFFKYLSLHPQLESIMHIPLNAAFMVQIYKQSKCSPQVIPQTLTQLYKALVEGLLLRYMKALSEFSTLRIAVDIENLPEPIKIQFEGISILAFTSFTKLHIQRTFSDTEVESHAHGCLDFLGLMQSSTDLLINTSTTVTHSFLHFTIQEFLAAYHLSKQPAQVQQLFIRFLIGLNNDAILYLGELADPTIATAQLHWLFESQSPSAVCRYLGDGEVKYDELSDTTSLALYALSYCLCNSDCRWQLALNVSNLTSMHMHSSRSDRITQGGKIQTLSLIVSKHHEFQSFFTLPNHLFSGLQKLEIVSKQQGIDSSIAAVLKLVPNLNYFLCINAHSTITLTLESLCTHCFSLEGIGFSTSQISKSDMIKLCQYVTSPTCSSSKVTLVLWANIYEEEDCLQYFFSAIACSKFLTRLSLLSTKLSSPEVEMLSVALSMNSSIEVLELGKCSIDGEGAVLLALELEKNKVISHLDLRFNIIDPNGAAALGSMLTVNTSLKSLILIGNELMGTDGALRLISALEQNEALRKLFLPSECKPIEYESIVFMHLRDENRVVFISTVTWINEIQASMKKFQPKATSNY